MSTAIDPTANAGNPNPAAGGAPNAGGAPSDWTTGFNDELKGYVQNKGFKDPSAVVESYRNFEKLMGVPQDRILRIPEKAEDQDAWNSIYNRLGRPEKPEEYGIKAGEKDNPKAVEWAKKNFHELGLTRKQAESLYERWNGFANESLQEQETAMTLEAEKQQAALKKEWGAEFDQRVKIGKAAALKFGITPEVLDTIEKSAGFAGVMKFMHAVGAGLGEDQFVQGGGKNQGGMTKEGARAEIQRLQTDTDFHRRLNAGESEAKKLWDRLHVQAYSAE